MSEKKPESPQFSECKNCTLEPVCGMFPWTIDCLNEHEEFINNYIKKYENETDTKKEIIQRNNTEKNVHSNR